MVTLTESAQFLQRISNVEVRGQGGIAVYNPNAFPRFRQSLIPPVPLELFDATDDRNGPAGATVQRPPVGSYG